MVLENSQVPQKPASIATQVCYIIIENDMSEHLMIDLTLRLIIDGYTSSFSDSHSQHVWIAKLAERI